MLLIPNVVSAYTSTDYYTKINLVKAGFLDNLWNGTLGFYVDPTGEYYTNTNIFMLKTLAIMAGHGEASGEDIARARILVTKLTTTPCYNYLADLANTWSNKMDGSSTPHWALDQQTAESLYFAWKYRTALGLNETQIDSIIDILQTNKTVSGWYLPAGQNLTVGGTAYDSCPVGSAVCDNQTNCRWQLNRLIYAKVSGSSAYDADIAKSLKRCIYYLDHGYGAPNTGNNSNSGLFPDYSWRYIENSTYDSQAYNAMAVGGVLILYPDISSIVNLTSNEINKLKAWTRHTLGKFLTNGYPNWDDTRGGSRLHNAQYWMFQLEALLGIARSNMGQSTSDYLYAKWLLDKAVDTFFLMDTWNNDFADYAISNPFAIGSGGFEGNKGAANSFFVSNLALAIDFAIADQSSVNPVNLWQWGWYYKFIKISTEKYGAATILNGPDEICMQHWGFARLQDTNSNRILTSIGGYENEGMNFAGTGTGWSFGTNCNGNSCNPTSYAVYRDGNLLSVPSDYSTDVIPLNFNSSLKVTATKSVSPATINTTVEYYQNYIDTTYSITTSSNIANSSIWFSIPLQKTSVVTFKKQDGTTTTVWDRPTITNAGSIDISNCKYIHAKNAGYGVGLLLVPIATANIDNSSYVTMTINDPVSEYCPSYQTYQDRSILIYLIAGNSFGVTTRSITFRTYITNGSDVDAESILANGTLNFGSGGVMTTGSGGTINLQ
jgi:hypothetical protein